MKTVSGVFAAQSDAEHAMSEMRLAGAQEDRITLLTPGGSQGQQESVWAGVGPVSAAGPLGRAVLAAARGTATSGAGGGLENSITEELPEDKLFVFEDALRRGHSVVVALVSDEAEASRLSELLQREKARDIEAVHEQWWLDLRSAEQEHYSAQGRNFRDDEIFYRLGFEAALHARTRCKEYDQTLGEMDAKIWDLEKQYPGREVAEPFSRGYERGRNHYQNLCDESRAA
jgi:GNAT superfamily N-acetyltransferase